MTYTTRHATIRARQHAIPPLVETLLDEFGERVYDGHGGIRVRLPPELRQTVKTLFAVR